MIKIPSGNPNQTSKGERYSPPRFKYDNDMSIPMPMLLRIEMLSNIEYLLKEAPRILNEIEMYNKTA